MSEVRQTYEGAILSTVAGAVVVAERVLGLALAAEASRQFARELLQEVHPSLATPERLERVAHSSQAALRWPVTVARAEAGPLVGDIVAAIFAAEDSGELDRCHTEERAAMAARLLKEADCNTLPVSEIERHYARATKRRAQSSRRN